MKYLKSFNESSNLDIDFAISKIKEKWGVSDVKKMIDSEVENWVDDDWKTTGAASPRDWYDKHNGQEAEEIVLDTLTDWFCDEFKKDLSEDQISQIHKSLKKEYGI